MQNKKNTNGLMMFIPSLYKAIVASKTDDDVMNDFCSNKISGISI